MDDRKLDVLRAIVEDYVATREPVGSKALSERHNFGVSSATLRNDMAVLEEEGYISAPHTSAGRVPTDKGYRLFVDRLAQIKPLSTAERRAIHQFLDSAVDLDDVMQRTVRLLAQLTHQVALVQYPTLTRSGVRHVEIVGIGTRRILLIVIADTGRVEQRTVESPIDVTDEALLELRSRLNAAVVGRSFTDVSAAVQLIPEKTPDAYRPMAARVLATLLETVVERREDRIVMGGTANLTRFGEDYSLTVGPVLEALEEHVVLLRLLQEVGNNDDLTVRIGAENEVAGLSTSAVVTTGYGPRSQSVAHIGVLGPTRMDYPGTMGSVRAVARYLGRILSQ
jgi:heat-inducible transcriptional repressor